MRQGEGELALLDRLLRIRNDTISEQDWLDINSKYENYLQPVKKANFSHAVANAAFWVAVRLVKFYAVRLGA